MSKFFFKTVPNHLERFSSEYLLWQYSGLRVRWVGTPNLLPLRGCNFPPFSFPLEINTDAFTHRPFYTQTLLHTTFSHTEAFTQALLHTDAFTHRRFYTQTILHTDAFTHRRFYTQTLLHTDAFTHNRFYTRHFYTQTLLHTDAFTHRHFYTDESVTIDQVKSQFFLSF